MRQWIPTLFLLSGPSLKYLEAAMMSDKNRNRVPVEIYPEEPDFFSPIVEIVEREGT